MLPITLLTPMLVRHDPERRPRWTARDAAVLKEIGEELSKTLPQSAACTHLRGNGGLKGAIRRVPPRRDLKQLKRDLAKVKKTGKFPDEGLQRFAKDHTLDFALFNPGSGLPEKIKNLLAEIETDPPGFMISGPKPQILYTLTLFDLFSGLGLNVSRGSAGDLVALTDKSEAPDTLYLWWSLSLASGNRICSSWWKLS